MSYTINLTNGAIFATIPDGTINTSSSMVLVGKNYAGYGEFLDENFIHLLENSSNSTAPTAPLTGQLWWDSTNALLKVYNGSTFKVVSGATASATAPVSTVAGDLWYDSTNSLLKVYTGSGWLTVGPSTVNGTGATPVVISDTLNVSHNVIELTVGNTVVGIVSSDAAFTPSPSISGFANVRPGFQLSTQGGAYFFQGTATESQTLAGLTSSQFMRTDNNTSTSGSIAVTGNVSVGSGLINAAGNGISNIGGAGAYFGTVHAASYRGDGSQLTGVVQPGAPTTTVSATGNIAGGNILTAGLVSATGTIVGGNILTAGVVSATSNITGGNLITLGSIINAGGNGVGNIGGPGAYFGIVYATATSAQYADVAERFAADADYEAGTVVELGGSAEITKVGVDLSDKVFGVISTRAAYLMNAGAGTDNTHPPVAMTGRVPVKVIGTVNKGDRLVSAGNGVARAAAAGEASAFNTIGRALANKLDAGLGTVEAIVTIK